jgi:transposase, IS5 family
MRGLMALSWEDGLNALVAEGIEAIVFCTVGDQCSLWESVLPEELLRLPKELARVDALLDDARFSPRLCRSLIRGWVVRRHRWRPICG